MRISDIHVYQKTLPIEGKPYTMARTVLHELDSTIVKLVTDTGLIGWGETCPIGPVYQPHHALGARAALSEVAPALVGADVQVNTVYQIMDDSLNAHHYAKSAIDVAVHDLLGKQYGVPVSELLGGARVDRVPSYFATGIGEPDEIARLAKEKVAEGYRRIQIKLGGRHVQEDVAVIRKTWEVIGPQTRLVVDANRSLTPADTITLSQQCRDIPLAIEQPCNTLDEIAAIKDRLCHPVYLDESTTDLNAVVHAIAHQLCDGFGLKISRLGGLSRFAVVRDLCAAHSLPHSCEDSWGGDLVSAASVHMGSTVQPRMLEGVWLAAPYMREQYDPINSIQIENGYIIVPTGPGLGIEPNAAVMGEPCMSFG